MDNTLPPLEDSVERFIGLLMDSRVISLRLVMPALLLREQRA